jgi:hypothetical protein
MEDVRFIGLDVHTESIAIGMAEPGRGEAAVLATIPDDTGQLTERLRQAGNGEMLLRGAQPFPGA